MEEVTFDVMIGIDCAPGASRPDKYIGVVFSKLRVTHVEPSSKCFGAWVWNFTTTEEVTKEERDWIKMYFNGLYNRGRIRRAEWAFED
jgi:hypothetical protein